MRPSINRHRSKSPSGPAFTSYEVVPGCIVQIHDDVHPTTRTAVEFQIGSHQVDFPGSPSIGRIRFLPWPRLPATTDDDKFHQMRGQLGHHMIAEESRLGIFRTGEGFDIYCEQEPPLVNIFLQAVLGKAGHAMVHGGAAVAPSGQTVLLAGAGGIGKTRLITHLCQHHGMHFSGDDIVLVHSSGRTHPFLRKMVLKHDHDVAAAIPSNSPPNNRSRTVSNTIRSAVRFLLLNMPFSHVLRSGIIAPRAVNRMRQHLHNHPWASLVAPEQVFSAARVGRTGNAGPVLLVSRSGTPGSPIQPETGEAADWITSIMMHEWSEHARFLSQLGAFGLLSPTDLWSRHRANVYAFLNHASIRRAIVSWEVDIIDWYEGLDLQLGPAQQKEMARAA